MNKKPTISDSELSYKDPSVHPIDHLDDKIMDHSTEVTAPLYGQ